MSLRKNLLICLVSAMAFGMYACADDPNTVESNDPAPAACTADACQDDNTLLQCLNGTATPVPCPNGCLNNACKPAAQTTCTGTAPKCSDDGQSVIICVNGTEQKSPCANGCSNGSCNKAPEPQGCDYTAPKCSEDEQSLLTCESGTEHSERCENGCENGACKETPKCDYTEPKCSEDEQSLLTCESGTEHSERCENGCENGACKEAPKCDYTAPKCSEDKKSLLTCKSGTEHSEPCANGCENGACKETPKCDYTAPKCSEDKKSLLTCKSGTEHSEPCPNGCENGACKEDPKCTYTAPKCSEDKKSLLTCKSGTEHSETCANGCADGKCLECSVATETKDCKGGKICVDGACHDPECTAPVCSKDDPKKLLKCVNGRISKDVETECTENKCVQDAFGDGKDACVGADYCKAAEDCAGREDKKTTCVYKERTCKTFACSNADCKSGETCVLGVCVPGSDLTAKYGDVCAPDKFVPHCREKILYECRLASNNNGEVWKVGSVDCGWKGCYAYQDGTNLVSACREDMTHEEACGDGNEGTFCEESAEQGWMMTYACVTSTNAEPIVVIKNMEMCDEGYGCIGDKMCE